VQFWLLLVTVIININNSIIIIKILIMMMIYLFKINVFYFFFFLSCFKKLIDGNIILWQQSEQKEVLFGEEEDNFNKETWRIVSMLRY